MKFTNTIDGRDCRARERAWVAADVRAGVPAGERMVGYRRGASTPRGYRNRAKKTCNLLSPLPHTRGGRHPNHTDYGSVALYDGEDDQKLRTLIKFNRYHLPL